MDPSVMAGDKKEPVAHLKNILAKRTRIDPKERKRNMKIVQKFIDDLVLLMRKSDDLFNQLFSRIYRSGSSFEGLGITDSNEFDIDLVLKFPIKKEFRKLHRFDSDIPCYRIYQLQPGWESSMPKKKELYALIKNRFVEKDYIIPQKIRSWIHSVVDTAGKLYTSDAGPIGMKFHESGPTARSAVLITTVGNIKVDLVTVIEFTFDEWRDNITFSRLDIRSEARFLFLVPETVVTSHDVCGLSEFYSRYSWRIHLPEVEKAIINKGGCVKPVIKLLKLLRDTQGWYALSSYFLKTVVMWKVIQEPEDNWKENFMRDRFIEALESLFDCIHGRKMPHILFPKYNLLAKLGLGHAMNINPRLGWIIEMVKIDPTNFGRILNREM